MKKILLTIFTICACFLFSNNVDALQCMYESNNGERVALYQYYTTGLGGKDYDANVVVIDSFSADGNTAKPGDDTIVDGVINDWEGVNEWKKVSSCPKKLSYKVDWMNDNAYACDTWGECKTQGNKKFYLIEGYTGKTPAKVALQEMVCTYEFKEASGGSMFPDTYTFMITINDDNTMHYSLYHDYEHLYDNDVALDGINKNNSGMFGYSEKTYYDSFQPRVFWSPITLEYKCADQIAVTSECDSTYIPGIMDPITGTVSPGYSSSTCDYHIGYNEKGLSQEELDNLDIHESSGFFFSQRHDLDYDLYDLSKSASYIKYDPDASDYNVCAYTYPDAECNPKIQDDCNPLVMLSLIGRENKNNGEKSIITALNDGYLQAKADINLGELSDLKSCTGLPNLYTDCFTSSDKTNCKVLSTNFANAEKLVPAFWSNTQSSESVEEGLKETNGFEYRKLLCELSDRLEVYVPQTTLNTLPSLRIYSANLDEEIYKINKLDCKEWGINTAYECKSEECKNQAMYNVELKVTEIRNYCDRVYKRYINNTIATGTNQRKDECFAFDTFYNDMVAKGIISDLSDGCDYITPELAEKLMWILDLLKIAGPIAALGLGTLDFVKAIASGDSDKEMKSAFKRFTTRMIAAVLLFILPLLLAFILDTFIGNQDGYDPENPFCNVVDWTD